MANLVSDRLLFGSSPARSRSIFAPRCAVKHYVVKPICSCVWNWQHNRKPSEFERQMHPMYVDDMMWTIMTKYDIAVHKCRLHARILPNTLVGGSSRHTPRSLRRDSFALGVLRACSDETPAWSWRCMEDMVGCCTNYQYHPVCAWPLVKLSTPTNRARSFRSV